MSAGAAAGAGAGAGGSGGAPLSEAEQRYTKRAILQLLESEYEDEGCQVLFGALSALPSHDPRLLLGLMAAVAKAQSATVAPDDWGRALAVFDLECAKCVHQIVLNILLRELRQLSGHVKFWKTSIQSPVSHFLVNGRFEWFRNRPRGLEWSGLLTSFIPFVGSSAWGKYLSHVQRADVNEKLDRLDQCEESFAAQVGHLHSWIGHMEKIVSFRADVRAFNQYVAKLFDFVSGTSGREAGNDAVQVLHQLEDTLHALPEFESWFSTQLAPYRKPSHVRRHWLAYAMVGVGSVFVANKLYTNRAELAAWGRSTARDAGAFVHSHVTEPVQSLYNSVFHTFRDRQNLAASREQLELSRQSLAAMLQDFGANPTKQAQLQAQREGKSHAQYMKELPARAAAHDMSIVMPRYEDGVAHPIKSLSNGELVRGLLIQVQKVKVESEAAMLAMDQVLKANELNFSVLAIIPAVVLFGFGMLAVKRLVFRKPSRAVLHRRMRRQLRRIESVLIAHYGSGKPSLDDKSTGFLLLYLQKLDDLVRNGLPQREQTDILADIATLRSVDLSIQQKHLMIARMYRAYALTDDKTI